MQLALDAVDSRQIGRRCFLLDVSTGIDGYRERIAKASKAAAIE